ncbi:MAG: dTDP-glucose 4,6-dehydratase [Verrucomicrobiales bacterium]|nr:dTDP-glucose 4,6-dehydratase [Verrucomicrobiales bacterium]
MMSRIELVRQDAEAVVANRTHLLSSLRNSHIFITGGTGFLGTWLLELLSVLNAKHNFNIQASVLSRSALQFAEKYKHLGSRPEFRFINGDIRYLTEVPRATNYIIHAAALTDRRLFASNPTLVGEVNAVGAMRLLRAADLLDDLKQIVLVSSGLVAGPQALNVERIDENYTSGIPCNTANAIYPESKRFAESMATSFVSESKLPLVIVRPFAFLGPYQSLELPWAITDFIRDSLAGRPIKIMGDGSTVRSLMYASDYAFWTLAALSRGTPREVYNIGSPEGIHLLALAKLITQHFSPLPEILTKVGQSGHDATRLVPNIAKAQRDLGVQVTVSLSDAIQNTITWHKTAASS